MGSIVKMSAILAAVFCSAIATAQVENGGYACRQTGSGVCAVNKATGQCTSEWRLKDGGDPMFFCKKFIGLNPGGSVNWSDYYCKDFGGYVCAVSKIHGQCTASWSKHDGGDAMYFCQKQLGLVHSAPKAGRFTCKDFGNFVCAVSNATGQCTTQWDNKDGSGMFQCRNFLKH